MADDMNITFLLMPDRVTRGISLKSSETILDAKKKLSRASTFPTEQINLSFNGIILSDDEMTLAQCGISSNFPDNQIVVEARCINREDRESYSMPKSFDVVVYPGEDGEDRDEQKMPTKIRVEVESKQDKKAYLGGFKHSKSGAIYHNATTQTKKNLKQKSENMPERFHRETQTHEQKTRSTQSARETGTQMKKKGLSIDQTQDKVIKAGTYFTSKQLDALRLDRTIVIQCYWRQYKARCAAWAKRDAIAKRKRDLDGDIYIYIYIYKRLGKKKVKIKREIEKNKTKQTVRGNSRLSYSKATKASPSMSRYSNRISCQPSKSTIDLDLVILEFALSHASMRSR